MELRGLFAHRVFVEDPRRDGRFLRATWHPEGRQLVVSHWEADSCVAATRVAVDDLPELLALLANALADSSAQKDEPDNNTVERAS